MALLDMCRKEGLRLVVAHMNYQKRDTANRDMELVRSYCAHFHIPFEARLQTKRCVGNFQAFAREERYRMYQELLKQYDASAVLLAHHLDDHLETYLMAKERGSMKEYLGIQEEALSWAVGSSVRLWRIANVNWKHTVERMLYPLGLMKVISVIIMRETEFGMK